MKFLVGIDVQNDFITGALHNDLAIAKMPNLYKYIDDVEADFAIATMDWHDKNYLSTMEGKHLNVPHCIAGTEGAKIDSEFLKKLKEKFKNNLLVVKKRTFGYYNWKNTFNKIFKNLGVNVINYGENLEFIFIGFCTDICVISNVMIIKALFPNAKIQVKESCCAGVDKQGHDEALRAMQRCHIDII